MDEMAQPVYGMLFQNHLASEGALTVPGWGALGSKDMSEQTLHRLLGFVGFSSHSLAGQEASSAVQLAYQ